MTRVAYILAASHSGSTLLSMLLSSHPQMATVGEMKIPIKAMGDLARYRCSCGELILKCRFWQKVKESMAGRGFAFDLGCAGTDYHVVESQYARRWLGGMYGGRAFEMTRDIALGLSPTWWMRSREIHRRNAALASVICEITNAEIIVDSSKGALRLKYLLRNPELDVRVIRLIRDGRAVALTYMDPARFADAQEPSRRGGGMGGGRESQRLSMAQAAYEWRRSIEESENIVRCLAPSQRTEVRYEEYCKNPETILSTLYRFLGVKCDGGLRRFREVEQHMIGNGMRLDTTSEVRLDERWRVELTARDLESFHHVAGAANRRYGYV